MKPLFLILIFTLFLSDSKAQKPVSVHAAKSEVIIDAPNPVEKSPMFPGGEKAYGKFLEKNLKWPDTQIDAQGRVIISFFVEKDGRLTNFKLERGLGEPFDQEALRILKKSPRWIPAKQNGKAVRIRYSVPINFILSE
jgi:protein TonB